MVKYSFILPVYNVELYLEQCVDSILMQELDDYEIILVDDGSTDGCPAICDEYIKKDPRIKVVHKTNGGLSDARNSGLDIASGKYILFVDPDDYLEKNYLKIIDDDIDNNDMLVFGCYYLYRNKRVKGFSENNTLTCVQAQRYMMEDDKICGYAWNKVYKKSIIDKKNLRFDLSATMNEDVLFSYQYLKYVKKVKLIDATIINYRQRKSSLISQKIKKIKPSALAMIYSYIIDDSSDDGIVLKCKSLYLKSYYKFRKYAHVGDFDLNMVNKIEKIDYASFSSRDKKLIIMYKYLPFFRTVVLLVDSCINRKYK